MNDEAEAKFAENLRGSVIGRGHPDYEEARKLYNGMIDKHPRVIARCADVADDESGNVECILRTQEHLTGPWRPIRPWQKDNAQSLRRNSAAPGD